MYYDIFVKKFYIIIVILVIGIIASIFFLLDKSYWDKFEYLREDLLLRYIFKSIPPILVIGYIWLVAFPIIRDKSVIDSGNYCVQVGIVSQAVTRVGAFGLSETIIVHIDNEEFEFSVAFAEDDINDGDTVKVTYLPYSKYAVIEKNS